MRQMNLPPFPRTIEISDFEYFLRTRLGQTICLWPEQAFPLLCYMCYPNDPEPRDDLYRTLWQWAEASETARPTIPPKLGRIQHEWLRVADIFHHFCDLLKGEHQEHRGGPSVGKAITLVEENTESRGTGAATLWKLWAKYKDVAHLISAAALICADARNRFPKPLSGPFDLDPEHFLPLHLTMLMPDLVLAVGMEFERLGLIIVSDTRDELALDPNTVWRIRPEMNVVPFPLHIRKLRLQDLVVLDERRAGNRGRANRI